VDEEEEDDDDAGLAGLLCASHLSSESARLLLFLPLLVLLDATTFLLFMSTECWPPEDDDEEEDAGPPAGLILCASHLPAASARLGLGGELLLGRRMAHGGGAGSSGNIVQVGGVGSSPGRAACAMARCTRATGIAMDVRPHRTGSE
jgi:hypothetical protein